MPVPNPVMPVKGAGTTLWVYKGNGDPYANPLSDVDWSRLAKVKDLTPGELTAESYDDSYLDDEDADWTATGQGQKSAGDTSFTLAWMPGEQGQQALLAWFNEGDTRAYKIRFPNGTVDVFRGWVSSIGKAVTAKEVITRTVKVTNVRRPSMAEDRSTVTAAIWRPQGCIRCRCQRRSRAMCCCAVLVHRCRIMPPFTVVMASCCTIFLNN
ncbi:hypothetical protein ESCOCP302M_20730 [Escherichia coli]